MSSSPSPTIMWFRDDLRLADNAALHWAVSRGPVVPVFILDDTAAGDFALGGASRWWLHHALEKLADDLRELGATLILRRGDTQKILLELAKETNTRAIGWNRNYEPLYRERDAYLVKSLENADIETRAHPGFLLFEPEEIKTNGGTSYRVYTPFSRACLQSKPPADALHKPNRIESIGTIAGDKLQDWKLVPHTAKWPKGLAVAWKVGEAAAYKQLKHFIEHALKGYKQGRDRPDQDMTSRLSPYLRFGHISPRQIWHAIDYAEHTHTGSGADIERFRLELLWREFSWHLISHFPHMLHEPLTPSFKKMAWRKNAGDLKRWQMGQTGYPIVDAGMRQLWQTGWMHNRVRMIVASFLIKDLLIDWLEGMMWFWDTLVDADLGNNTNSWQWVAGCGADAAPFFRIFNPTLQGQKFDPHGSYVRQYVPELAKLDAAYIHEPWKAPPAVLQKAGITLGQTYPEPMINHGVARARALEHLAKTKG